MKSAQNQLISSEISQKIPMKSAFFYQSIVFRRT